jgi:propionyl-CoA carboxylase beta chain
MGPSGREHRVPRRARQGADPAAARAKYLREYREKLANPTPPRSLGYVDEVIRPRARRAARLVRALAAVGTKRDSNPPKKHGNIPL